MPIKFSCGACGRKFAAKEEHAGRRSKCPSCGWQIIVPMPAPTDAAQTQAQDPPPVPPAVPADEPAIATGSAAHLVRAGGHLLSTRRLLVGSLAANLLLAAVVGYQSRLRDREYGGPTGDYRDVLLEMKLWPRRTDKFGTGPDKELEEAHHKSREFYSEMVRSMPAGNDGLRLLVDTVEYFKGDVVDFWIQCRSCSTMLGFHGIRIEPIDALNAANRYTARCWPILVQELNRKQVDVRSEFFIPYQSLRREGRSHQQAIDAVINEKWEYHMRARR